MPQELLKTWIMKIEAMWLTKTHSQCVSPCPEDLWDVMGCHPTNLFWVFFFSGGVMNGGSGVSIGGVKCSFRWLIFPQRKKTANPRSCFLMVHSGTILGVKNPESGWDWAGFLIESPVNYDWTSTMDGWEEVEIYIWKHLAFAGLPCSSSHWPSSNQLLPMFMSSLGHSFLPVHLDTRSTTVRSRMTRR